MQILYFAWLRERIGKTGEELTPPATITTARALVGWLRGQGAGYAAAFADETLIRCAINQEFCPLDSSLEGVREIAFFPPVTGG